MGHPTRQSIDDKALPRDRKSIARFGRLYSSVRNRRRVQPCATTTVIQTRAHFLCD